MAKVSKNYPKKDQVTSLIVKADVLNEHFKNASVHLTPEEKKMIQSMMDNGAESYDVIYEKIQELLKQKADINHTHEIISEDIIETDNKKMVSKSDIDKWNDSAKISHEHSNMSILEKITEDSNGDPLYNGKSLKGKDGERGQQGIQGPQGPQGNPFSIKKIYSSVEEMNNDYSNNDVQINDFVLINTGNVEDEDNAKLFIKGESAFEFITDLSGAQGVQGPAGPQGPQGVDGARGRDGERGAQGEKGDKGDQGDNGVFVGDVSEAPETANIVVDDSDEGFFFEAIIPDIQVGEVTTLEPGEEATVTRRGSDERPIFDFGIPRGFDGAGKNNTSSPDIVIVDAIDSVLNLTTDKYQVTNIQDNTTIILPEVTRYTEISLHFAVTSDFTIIFPNIKWSKYPRIIKNRISKITFFYLNGEWLGEYTSYSSFTDTPILDGLVCWLDGYDIPINTDNMIKNMTIWQNRANVDTQAIIKTVNCDEVKGNEQGYFRTVGKSYVKLPTFEFNNCDGITVFIDGKMNKSPTGAYDRLFDLRYSTSNQHSLALVCGKSEFGVLKSFGGTVLNSKILGELNTNLYPMKFNIGATTEKFKNFSNGMEIKLPGSLEYNSIFYNNFLNAETDSVPTSGDFSYGLVLIYNRTLTEEEMMHNYIYSLSIKRGDDV